MPLHSSSTTAAALAVGAASLSLVAGYVPLGAPSPAFAPGLGGSRQARCPGIGAACQLSARPAMGRPAFNLQMVDVSPRAQVDISSEDFVGSGRMGSVESEAYAPDDGGTEVSQYDDDDEVLSSDEERDPGDVSNFPISDQTLDALARKGITKLFPVQSATFNEIYTGRDVLARARTGTGKTLGFALPILERLISDKIETGSQRRSRGTKPSCIILSPTRELAVQIEREIEWLTESGDVKVSTLCVYGGVPYSKQERELRNGVDMVVGTPGRMIDLYEKGALDLSEAKYLVLDEADEMLNKGFADDVEHLMEGMPTGTERPQTLLFSATEPPWVKQLARKNLVNHHAVDLVGNSKVKLAEGITNVAVTATARQRSTMLADLITLYRSQHAIVFVNTKREADELVAELGIIMKGTEALHGDIPQGAREKILNGFRSGRIPVLIATDVAARGLDIDHVDLVVHHGVPQSVENFIHRSGRTGRAGRKGTSLVLYDKNEQWSLNRIEKDAGIKFEKRGAPQPDEVMEASAWRAAANLANVNPELEPYFLPMAEKLMQEDGVTKLAQALAFMSGYKAPPSKRSLQTGEDELRTVQLKPSDETGGRLEVRDVMRIVSGCLATADPQQLSAADTRIGRIARCTDGSAVIDISPKGAEFLTETLKSYSGSRFFAPGDFVMPEELPPLFEEQRRGGYGGRGGGGYRGETGYNRRGGGGYRGGGGGYRGGGGGYRGGGGGGGYRGGYGGGRGGGFRGRDDSGGGFTVVRRGSGGYGGGGGSYGGNSRDSWGGSSAERSRKEERWN